MPTPAQLQIALHADVYEAVNSPAPPPTPRPTSSASTTSLPAIALSRSVHTQSAPASLPASRRPELDGGIRRSSSRPQTAPSGGGVLSLPSRNGSPSWSRPTSSWGSYTATRAQQPRLYEGKERAAKDLGQFGPGFYDVRCSKTGTPRNAPAKGTPTFGGTRRFNRERCYEGKERTATLFGQFGPGERSPPRCTNRGVPNWRAPTSGFGATTQPRLVSRAAPAA